MDVYWSCMSGLFFLHLINREKNTITRSSRSKMFFKIGVLKNYVIFTGKHLCWSLKVCNFTKQRLQHWCFPVNIAKFLRKPFFIELLRWLLLHYFLLTFFYFLTLQKGASNRLWTSGSCRKDVQAKRWPIWRWRWARCQVCCIYNRVLLKFTHRCKGFEVIYKFMKYDLEKIFAKKCRSV